MGEGATMKPTILLSFGMARSALCSRLLCATIQQSFLMRKFLKSIDKRQSEKGLVAKTKNV